MVRAAPDIRGEVGLTARLVIYRRFSGRTEYRPTDLIRVRAMAQYASKSNVVCVVFVCPFVHLVCSYLV